MEYFKTAMLDVLLKGFLLSGSMIAAIGSQNIFVLKQGLLKNHVFTVCFLCFMGDAVLMSIGVMGLGNWINESQALTNALALGGAVFLAYYGCLGFIGAYKGNNNLSVSSSAEGGKTLEFKKVLLITLAVTLLNPHVYLDTVVIVGGIAGTLSGKEKMFFLTGAVLASLLWFFSLGYGARLLAPLFKRQSTWRILDFSIGCIMFFISFNLIRYVLAPGN